MGERDVTKHVAQSNEVEKAASPNGLRPSQHLIAFHLQESLRANHLGAEPRSKVTNGSVDLYNRFKAKDPVDSLYAAAIVALNNAVMGAYGEAARGGQFRDENLGRAFEGTSILIDLVRAFETRRDLTARDDHDLRAKLLESVMERLDSGTKKSAASVTSD